MCMYKGKGILYLVWAYVLHKKHVFWDAFMANLQYSHYRYCIICTLVLWIMMVVLDIFHDLFEIELIIKILMLWKLYFSHLLDFILSLGQQFGRDWPCTISYNNRIENVQLKFLKLLCFKLNLPCISKNSYSIRIIELRFISCKSRRKVAEFNAHICLIEWWDIFPRFVFFNWV